MKLAQLQEAKYASPHWVVDWVQGVVEEIKQNERIVGEEELDRNEWEECMRELTHLLGPPKDESSEYSHEVVPDFDPDDDMEVYRWRVGDIFITMHYNYERKERAIEIAHKHWAF